jgi:branched-chain amino acid aminotransferase
VAKYIYLNGELVQAEKASVSLFDHGLLYGDGVFEGIRCYSGNIFKLKEHVARLYRSAKSIGITIPMTPEEMMDAHVMTVAKNGLRDAYIRSVVTRGTGDLGLDPRKCPTATVFIIADTISLFPPEMYEKGIKLITSAFRRTKVDALNAQIKSCNYLNNIHAKIQANQAGVMECLMLNEEGFVAEGTGDNVFIVKNGTLMTPPSSAGILEGITRDTVMDVAKELGIPVSVQNITLHDFYTAEEAFLTGTAAEVMPVIELDQRKMGDGVPGPLTVKIIAKFRDVTKKIGAKVIYEA